MYILLRLATLSIWFASPVMRQPSGSSGLFHRLDGTVCRLREQTYAFLATARAFPHLPTNNVNHASEHSTFVQDHLKRSIKTLITLWE